MLHEIKNFFALQKSKKKWIHNNKHNGTFPVSIFDHDLVTVGNGSYGELNIVSFNNRSKLKIGHYVSIAQNVTFLLDVEHKLDTVSTFPFKRKILNTCDEAVSKGDITIDDDVWIGYGAIIMSGVHIGQGAVVASGAIVTKNVDPYAIVGGVPAKLIRYRFSGDIIDYLQTLDFNALTKEMIGMHIDELYMDANIMSSDEIKKKYNWFPKRKTTHNE